MPIQDVSDTALWVAVHRARESERKDALFQDPLAAVLAGARGRAIARTMPYGSITRWIMAVRTVALDRLLLSALAQGADAVVNLGAGLDTRPYRMDLPKALRWIEVDFPHLVDFKEDKLRGQAPRCRLERIGLDLADRPARQALFARLGAEVRSAVVLTEGVIVYLTPEQGGALAEDLHAVPAFRFWVQDYQAGKFSEQISKRMRKSLARAPFQFLVEDPFAFFAARGWTAKEKILASDEGERLGRRFPLPFPANFLFRFAPAHVRESFRQSRGYALFENAATTR